MNKMKIERFENEYFFLSNFYMHPVSYEGILYPSSEHAYQASKTLDMDIRIEISKLQTAGQSKKYGRKLKLRPDWDIIKVKVMYEILEIKFKDIDLRQKLIDTNPHELIEGNWWGDTFWGVCNGRGDNYLGKILMFLRSKYILNIYYSDLKGHIHETM